ncbi:MAG: YgjP-like metallopeptidase domain-containing protein [Mycobacterium sp.]|uniref:YgjP-like metallopeptidase domain-containing protein n=1 Tax=Mycobacterium sp. TaxID=1785 RepID=UPI003CC64B80
MIQGAVTSHDPGSERQGGARARCVGAPLEFSAHEKKRGACNRETRHIWFNVELAKNHPDCLEYIAIREMTHYLERSRGQRLTTLMEAFMPDWRAQRDQLNESPLAHCDWAGLRRLSRC